MPSKAIDERAEQLALLQGIIHERIIAPEIGEHLAKLGSDDDNPLGDPALPYLDRALLRAVRRRFLREQRLPADLVTEIAKAATKGQAVWRGARSRNDFAAFAPSLRRLVELTVEKAACIGYTGHPYDALIDEYEPWTTTEDIQAIFTPMAAHLSELAGSIRSVEQVNDSFLQRRFATAKQEEFGRAVLADIGYEPERGRLDVSAHPFTTTLGFDDVRITARYDETFLKTGMSSITHEAGHALYELGFSEEIRGTILASGTSLGIHESQSRMWENIIGKSRPFWLYYYPRLVRLFPSELDGVTTDDFYRAVNKVESSLIRIEADEVTYGLHIALRFELETRLIAGDLSVEDAPAAWNEASGRLLGITPGNDAEGVLQDIHWSMGGMGYFPTYALGNLYGAQITAAMRKDLPKLDAELESGNLGVVLEWLRRNVHVHGASLTAEELCRRVTGEALNPDYFMTYLIEKYSPIYRL